MRAFVFLTVVVAACGVGHPPLCVRDAAEGPLPHNGSLQLHPGGLDFLDECDLPTRRAVRWRSAAPEIAIVDDSGRVRPKQVGRVRVWAYARDAADSAYRDLEIVPPVARLVLEPRDTVLRVGDTVTFRAYAVGPDGATVPGVRPYLMDSQDGGPDAPGGMRFRRQPTSAGLLLWAEAPASGRVRAWIAGHEATTRVTVK